MNKPKKTILSEFNVKNSRDIVKIVDDVYFSRSLNEQIIYFCTEKDVKHKNINDIKNICE